MKNLINTLFVAGLLLTLASVPLRAQTNTTSQAVTARTAEMERRLALDKFEADARKLELERQMAKDRLEAGKDMVHDLAWNSWVLVVIAFFFFRHLGRKSKHETIRLMVEKGVPITPEVLAGLKTRERSHSTKRDPHGYLAWGITLVAVGAGLLLVAGKAGWIVLLIGVADLILYAVDRDNRNGVQPK